MRWNMIESERDFAHEGPCLADSQLWEMGLPRCRGFYLGFGVTVVFDDHFAAVSRILQH
jgi:hypothetical protein